MPIDTLSLSPISLFLAAGLVGRAVMIVLALASIWCWILIGECLFTLRRLRRALHQKSGDDNLFGAVDATGQVELARRLPGEATGDRRRRLAEAMNRTARAILIRAEGRLPDLAVVASVSPFIGLFGTVWGIMVSFVGIAAAKDTSLAVVAPGIAEALAATAWGLAAAIPASVGYSRLGAAFGVLAIEIGDRAEAHAVDLLEREGAAT